MTARIPIAEQVFEAARELEHRRRLCAAEVGAGKISQAFADRHIALQSSILTTLQWLEKNETRIKVAMKGTEP